MPAPVQDVKFGNSIRVMNLPSVFPFPTFAPGLIQNGMRVSETIRRSVIRESTT
jgi:hypothetical protein